jgi:transitional endoplasmic reticulum ATPase
MAATREFVNSVPPAEMSESVGNVRVSREHFEHALDEVNPSVTDDVRERYEEIEQRFDRQETVEETEPRTFQ